MKRGSPCALGRRTRGHRRRSPTTRSRPMQPGRTSRDACRSHRPPTRSASPLAARSRPGCQVIQHRTQSLSIDTSFDPDRRVLEDDLDASLAILFRCRRTRRGRGHRQQRGTRLGARSRLRGIMLADPTSQQVRIDPMRQSESGHGHPRCLAHLNQRAFRLAAVRPPTVCGRLHDQSFNEFDALVCHGVHLIKWTPVSLLSRLRLDGRQMTLTF
jgi:hypothetical protein